MNDRNGELVHVGVPGRQIVVETPEPEYLAPVMDIQTARRRLAEFQEFVQGYLVDGEDYGTIPGTKRPTLLKPGADKLCELYGLAPTFPAGRQSHTSDWSKDPPFLKYTTVCVLTHKRTQTVVAEGMGSCNSYESKYKYRWQNGQRVLNHDVADQDNTLLKMSQKRALVQAVITVTRSSGIFTQDMEEAPTQPLTESPTSRLRRGRKPKPQEAQATVVVDSKVVEPKPAAPEPRVIEASLAGFAGCQTAADVERYWASEFELAKKAQNTKWMAELTKAKNKRRAELKDEQRPPADKNMFGEPNVFHE